MNTAAAACTVGRELRSWSWLIVRAAARCYLTILLTLLATAAAPGVGGWNSTVVLTGSMSPRIHPGDVAITAPLRHGEAVPVGRVVAFRSRTSASTSRVVVHRIIAANADGTYTSKGDANRSSDASPLPTSAIIGRARLLVPWVGLPMLWSAHHDTRRLVLWSLITLAAVAVTAGGGRTRRRTGPRRPQPETAEGPAAARSPRSGRPLAVAGTGSRLHARQLLAVGGAAALAALGVVFAAPASAMAFSARTADHSNVWTAASTLREPYTAAVLADGPWAYYPLDDASGPTMTDSSGNAGRAGTYTAPITYGQAGSGVTSFGNAITLAGIGARGVAATASAASAAPATYTIEAWFKTSTTNGGKLVGFESGTGPTSSQFDRTLFMDNAGHLVFGGWSGSGPATITTPSGYNNGLWHYVAVTAVPQGSHQSGSIYVDGTLAASGNTTGTSAYNGYWRIGSGSIASGSGYPTSANLAGSIDNVAIYTTALGTARIAAHYAAR